MPERTGTVGLAMRGRLVSGRVGWNRCIPLLIWELDEMLERREISGNCMSKWDPLKHLHAVRIGWFWGNCLEDGVERCVE